LDNPYVSGSFNVSVQDNGRPVSGVNVLLVDAIGMTLTGKTASSGIAAFNPGNIMVGINNAIIPTQSVTISSSPITVISFFQSVQPVTVVSSGLQSVAFNALTQSVSMWSLAAAEVYPYGGTSLAYGITYIQSGNLNEPVSFSIVPAGPSTVFPNNWITNYSRVMLGNGTNSGTVTIEIPCSVQQPYFEINATKSNGVSFSSAMHHITRDYQVNVQIDWVCVGYDPNTTYNIWNLVLQTKYDCGLPWTVNIFGLVNGNFVNGAVVATSEDYMMPGLSGTISNPQAGSFSLATGNNFNF
jgi:hypothetical protein